MRPPKASKIEHPHQKGINGDGHFVCSGRGYSTLDGHASHFVAQGCGYHVTFARGTVPGQSQSRFFLSIAWDVHCKLSHFRMVMPAPTGWRLSAPSLAVGLQLLLQFYHNNAGRCICIMTLQKEIFKAFIRLVIDCVPFKMIPRFKSCKPISAIGGGTPDFIIDPKSNEVGLCVARGKIRVPEDLC